MSNVAKIVERCKNNTHFSNIYKMIDGKMDKVQFTKDGVPSSPISHTSDEIAQIKHELYGAVEDNFIADFGADYLHYEDVCNQAQAFSNDALKQVVKDGFYNPLNGIGTATDPSRLSGVHQPLLLGPDEVTSLYANGGISAIIIDKKSKGVQLNGFNIKSSLFTPQELKDLQEYAESVGFSVALSDALRDGNIYGGSTLFPVLRGDNPLTMAMTDYQLFSAGKLIKNCINHWVSVDRWNIVVVPNYDLCAEDYMRPRSFYVPISGLEVHTDRSAIIKPKPQPYWAAIRQLGWGEPDSVGYLSALKGYEIMAMSIPIMCQQMSLLVHQLPLDGIIAQNGPDAAKKWQKENEEQLRDWSMLNPKAINSYGEIAVVNRSYSGFDSLVDAIRKDVSAKSGIPESILFYSQPSGIFNKTEEDVLLKQSETIRLIQRTVSPAINKVLPYIACSLWGLPDGWSSWEKYKSLTISFDTPVISSPSQKADIAMKYAQAIATLKNSGMDVKTAVGFTTKIASEVELPSDFEAMLNAIPNAHIDEKIEGVEGTANVSPSIEVSNIEAQEVSSNAS